MMKQKLNIICLYWVGAFRGRDFTVKDVWRLKENVDRYMNADYTFHVLTNDPLAELPGNIIELKHNWPGWWSKMELHRGDLAGLIGGRTLYLDLDTHVVGDLLSFFNYAGNLVMFGSPYSDDSKQGIIRKYQAAVMLFTPGVFMQLYIKFEKETEKYMKQFRSDQDLLGYFLPNLQTFPSRWLVKMAQLRGMDKLPDGVKIVTGQPKNVDFRNPSFAPWLVKLSKKPINECM